MAAQGLDAPAVDVLAALPRPVVRQIGAGAEEGVGDRMHVFLGVERVEDLNGVRKALGGDVPQPGGPSPMTTWRLARVKPRRRASRSTRWANGDKVLAVGKVSAVSMVRALLLRSQSLHPL